MIKLENHLGATHISEEYFANLVGRAASECFGVAGLVSTTPYQGFRTMIAKGDVPDKGVKVHITGGRLVLDLHIVVTYGVNISAIVQKYYPQGSLHSGGRYRYGGGEGQRVCGRYAGGIASRFGESLKLRFQTAITGGYKKVINGSQLRDAYISAANHIVAPAGSGRAECFPSAGWRYGYQYVYDHQCSGS